MFKKFIDKVKFIFKGPDNTNISFSSNIEIPQDKEFEIKQPRPEIVPDSIHDDSEYFINNDFRITPFSYEFKKV